MKIKIRTRFMKKIISKYISKLVSEAIDSTADIWIEDAEICMRKSRITSHLDVYANIDRKALFDAIEDL